MSNIVRFTSFGIALPFMLLGGAAWFIDTWQKRIEAGDGILLILCILVLTGLHLISWAGTRYRLPTDGIGLVFAGYALARLIRSRLPRVYLKLVPILQ